MENERIYDVIIVGAGIAGLTAAIYARRAGKSVLILEGKTHGGQIINTFDIANWPGEESISGVDLMNKIYHQVNNLGAEIEYEEVVGVQDGGDVKLVKTEDAVYSARTIIIAVGSNERKMEVAREDELTGRGVSYCATCDGAFFKGQPVVVVGGGNTALYDALYLADICEKVYVVHRRDTFRGDKILVDKLAAKPNVEFVMESHPVEILGEKKVSGLAVEDATGARRVLDVVAIFVAVGRIPATAAFSGVVKMDEAGYVVAGEDCHTSQPGIFVAGDCRTKNLRQLVTAAADGAVAATEASRY